MVLIGLRAGKFTGSADEICPGKIRKKTHLRQSEDGFEK